jgi:uncharacterized NAD(P)/FAD-binding protein YdhS
VKGTNKLSYLRDMSMMYEIDRKTRNTQIVILGGGFAGVEVAKYLDRTETKGPDVEITLVSRDNFTLLLRCLTKWHPAISSPPTFAILFASCFGMRPF